MLSLAEENYLKSIYKLQDSGTEKAGVATNHIAELLQTKPGSVSEMVRKLADKGLLHHQPYQGVELTDMGKSKALMVIRRHRLWETFLATTLGFDWDQVHDLAEELEHIRSEELIERLDIFLQRPAYDPHGDPIPDASGVVKHRKQVALSSLGADTVCTLTGVEDHDPSFLRFLQQLRLNIGSKVVLLRRQEYDGSNLISIDGAEPVFISQKVASNLQVIAS